MDIIRYVQKTEKHVYLFGDYIRNALINRYHKNTISLNYFDILIYPDQIKRFSITSDGIEAYPPKSLWKEEFTDLKECIIHNSNFTIDSLLIDIKDKEDILDVDEKDIIDILGGLEDIKKSIIKVIDPKNRFKKDPELMLRSFEYAAKLGFIIDKETFEAVDHNIKNIIMHVSDNPVSSVEILIDIIKSENSTKTLREMCSCNIMKAFDIQHQIYDIEDCYTDEWYLPNKLFFLLEDNNIDRWIKIYCLDKCKNITKDDIDVLKALVDTDILVTKYLRGLDIFHIKTVSEYVVSVNNNKNNKDILKYHRQYFLTHVPEDIVDEFFAKVEERWNIPKNISELDISGKDIHRCFGIDKTDIKNLKQSLLDEVYEGKINYDRESLMQRSSQIWGISWSSMKQLSE